MVKAADRLELESAAAHLIPSTGNGYGRPEGTDHGAFQRAVNDVPYSLAWLSLLQLVVLLNGFEGMFLALPERAPEHLRSTLLLRMYD